MAQLDAAYGEAGAGCRGDMSSSPVQLTGTTGGTFVKRSSLALARR